jgi:hypothetical protein
MSKNSAAHKQRMAERRARQNARQASTVVMTRAQFRQMMAGRQAQLSEINKQRATAGLRLLAAGRPAAQIIFASRYKPHQGKRECGRRAMPVMKYAEAA